MNFVFTPTIPYGELTSDSFNSSAGTVKVYLHFQIPVIGLNINSLSIVNGEVTTFTDLGNNNYSFDISALNYGFLEIFLPENICHTNAGVFNPKSNILYFDYRAPIKTFVDVRIYTPAAEPQKTFVKNNRISVTIENLVDDTNSECVLSAIETYITGIFKVSVRFSKKIKTFAAKDIEITNGKILSFKQETDYIYGFSVIPQNFGEVTIKVLENTVFDTVGNYVKASNILTKSLDLVAPYLTFFDGIPSDNNILLPTNIFGDTAGNEIVYSEIFESMTKVIDGITVFSFGIKTSEPLIDFDLSSATFDNCYKYSQTKLNDFDYFVSVAKINSGTSSSVTFRRGLFFDAEGNRNIDSVKLIIS